MTNAPDWIEQQLAALKSTTDKACQSKETALQFLKDAGILGMMEESEAIEQYEQMKDKIYKPSK